MSYRRGILAQERKHRNPITNPLPFDEDSDPERLNDTVVSIGERIVADEDEKREYVPLWEQEVTDEHGRRRFHGAFTGGFSAGYFNTVGSKEGWAPSTFTSSRESRAGHQAQKAEDFMDDEDKAMFGGGKITAKQDFRADGADKRPLVTEGDALTSIMAAPARDSAGIRLLKVMGWREGQGIGPRVRRGTKKTSERRVYGAELPPGLQKKTTHSIVTIPWEEATYAPEAIPLLSDFPVKNDRYGLGFDPPTLADITSTNVTTITSKPVGGFGIGVFDDDDDIEAYDRGDSRKDAFKYIADGTDEVEMSDVKVKAIESAAAAADRKSQFSTVIHTTTRKCKDGLAIPPGFKFEEYSIESGIQKWYSPPVIPVRYTPHHTFSPTDPTPETLAPHLHMVSMKEKGRALTAGQRGTILDEEQLQVKVPPKSVWSLLNPVERDKLVALEDKYTIVQHEKSPFISPKPQMQADKRVSDLLASRFTGGARIVADSDTGGLKEPVIDVIVEKGPNQYENAAKLGMFGRMTRSYEPFIPSRVLCRRFDVPIPRGRSEETYSNVVKKSENEWKMLSEVNPVEEKPPVVVEDEDAGVERPHLDLFKAIFDSDDDAEQSAAPTTALNMSQVLVHGALAAAACSKPPPTEIVPVDTLVEEVEEVVVSPLPTKTELYTLSDKFTGAKKGGLHYPKKNAEDRGRARRDGRDGDRRRHQRDRRHDRSSKDYM